MGKKLSKAPVYYTVTQVQFNHILNLNTYLPDLQAQMREIGFIDFNPQIYQNLVLPFVQSEGGQAPAPSIASQVRYLFGDMDARTQFILETNSLTLQSTAYETFESFLRTFQRGIEIVGTMLPLAFVERIGLRYLDAIFPVKEGDRLADYLVREVQGLTGMIQGTLGHSASETHALTPSGQLMSRVIIRDGRIGYPDNFSIQPLQPDLRFTQFEGRHAILDTDAFHLHREPFNVGNICSRMDALHEIIRQSFYATVTSHALAAWT
jgi:uncharacterized protein (TIGR04255 family)